MKTILFLALLFIGCQKPVIAPTLNDCIELCAPKPIRVGVNIYFNGKECRCESIDDAGHVIDAGAVMRVGARAGDRLSKQAGNDSGTDRPPSAH